MIGVAALIIILSVMNGFESEVRARIIKFQAHIRLRTFHDKGFDANPGLVSQISNLPHVAGISPYILEKGLIRSSKATEGVITKCVDPEKVREVSDIPQTLKQGDFNIGLVEKKGRQVPGILLGANLADKLQAQIGDVVTIIAATGLNGMLGQIPPNHPFVVTGIFATGLYEFDDLYAYISIAAAQRLYQMPGKISGIEIRLDDINKSDAVAALINDNLGYPFTTLTWFQMNKSLFSWMKIQKWTGLIVLGLIIMVAAFNIISNLIMVVLEKNRDIGILKALGAGASGISRIFVFQGLLTGTVGTILGCLVGYLLCWSQQTYKWLSLPGDVYIIDALPILMKATDFMLIAGVAILLCLLATLFPAAKAARMDPIEAIRYE